MRFGTKVRTDIGNLPRTWWAKKGAHQYSIVYVTHHSDYHSDFKRLIRDSGVDFMLHRDLMGMTELYFTNSDDWEAIAKLTDCLHYQSSMWDVVCKDTNPFIKKSKEPLAV